MDKFAIHEEHLFNHQMFFPFLQIFFVRFFIKRNEIKMFFFLLS